MVRRIHHVGIVVERLEAAYRFYRDVLGLPLLKEALVPDQRVRAALLDAGDTEVELLEPTDPAGGVARFLARRGEGLHHVCFDTADVDAAVAELARRGAELVDRTPRRGLAGRIALLHPRACAGVLVELATPDEEAGHDRGAPLHLITLLFTLITLGVRRKSLPSGEVWIHAAILLAGLLIFSGFLRWQLWHARLHLPVLVLSAAIFGLLPQVFSARFSRWLGILLLLSTLPVFYFNQNKPLVQDWNIFNLPRREVMIIRKNLVVPYIEGVNYLTGERRCTQLGLYLPDEEWEYPIWELYRAAEIGAFRIEHVLVNNRSNRLPLRPFEPCAIFATQPLPGGETVQVEGKTFQLTWEMLPVHIYTAE